ncbi:uncharacterized protein LOC106422185 [Brassica napus]|uniref:uncharacterized protein LOC106422185 n=1 Tax=Brassica napus TaxID=3708 RepID=UPI0006AB4D5B|nr:uncharacterized protein LOC106422185 [Brassica napus]
MEVRDGLTTSFWFDNWMGTGKLIDVTGAIGTTYLGLPRRALVYDVVSRNDWSLRNKRSRRFQTLYNQILAMPVPDADRGDDLVLWKRGEDDFQNSFSTTNTWEQLDPKSRRGVDYVEKGMRQEIISSLFVPTLSLFGKVW